MARKHNSSNNLHRPRRLISNTHMELQPSSLYRNSPVGGLTGPGTARPVQQPHNRVMERLLLQPVSKDSKLAIPRITPHTMAVLEVKLGTTHSRVLINMGHLATEQPLAGTNRGFRG